MHFVIKYFPEITIKSPPVRKRLIKQLQRNLRRVLASLVEEAGGELAVSAGWDRADVTVSDVDESLRPALLDVLGNTPGIAYFAEARLVDFSDLEELGQQVLAIRGADIAGKSFCVRAKRSGKHDFNSTDIERVLGAALNRGCES